MSTTKQTAEDEGAKSRDHARERHHFWRRAHRDWRVWTALILMLAMIGVYVMTDNLSLRPGRRAIQSTPAANAP